jgi:NADPH2:quinone reductase
VGGELTGKILKNMPKNSIIELYGVLAQDPFLHKIDAGDTLFKNKTLKGFLLTHWLEDKSLVGKLGVMRKLQKLLKHELKSQISQEYSLDQFQEAIESYMSGMSKGKVLIKPWKT